MKPLRFPCLVLDHDDTAVDSTAHLHHPAFLGIVAALRPGHPGASMPLEEYFRMNVSPGLSAYYREELDLSDEELEFEQRYWLDYVAAHVPAAYDGMGEIIREQRARGGYVCVVSHSRRENILRDYAANALPAPDLIYGSELPRDRWKPSPWPLEDIMARLGLEPGELLMVDDLPLGLQMAQAAGVPFAAACWAHNVPELRAVMEEAGVPAFDAPRGLYHWLFDEEK